MMNEPSGDYDEPIRDYEEDMMMNLVEMMM
jgi:hypothetical protein